MFFDVRHETIFARDGLRRTFVPDAACLEYGYVAARFDDMQQQFEREKEEQTTQIRSLSRELVLMQMIARSFIPDDQIAIIEGHCHYDEANKRCTIDYMDLAGCHRKVEEEMPEETVFIQGIEGAIFVSPSKPQVDEKRKAEEKRRKKIAVDRMLNEFALA